MTDTLRCALDRRKDLVRAQGLSLGINGIDRIEVSTVEADERRVLYVHFLHPVALTIGPIFRVRVTGGPDSLPVEVVSEERNYTPVVRVTVRQRGDDGAYRLAIVALDGERPPDGFDPVLCEAAFSFYADCPLVADCGPPEALAEPTAPPALHDALARDATSLRRLMFDRLARTLPAWTERNPADLGVALVELFAHVGDRVSYFQDAVGTEAHLATARRRTSVRRHARLVDYALHEGCNARVWVCFETNELKTLPARTRLAAAGALGFETMTTAWLIPARNELALHAWGAEECVLPRGATRAALRWPPAAPADLLAPGDALLFEEVADPQTGAPEGADRTRRHVVRLRAVGPALHDAIAACDVREVTWDDEDALPFDLTVSTRRHDTGALLQGLSVARGNLCLAEHAEPIAPFEVRVPERAERGALRLALPVTDLTWRADLPASPPSAARSLRQDPRLATPALALYQTVEGIGPVPWHARPDLLASAPEDRHFVVEVDRGRSYVRFGDDIHGRRPPPGTAFQVEARVGNGIRGHITPDLIHAVLSSEDVSFVTSVRNPAAAAGGVEPEPIEQARRLAPVAFRHQERAVTLDDWVAVAQRHPEVQRAVARLRDTGAWKTVFVTVDRRGSEAVDEAFRAALRAHLERYRLAGCDLEVEAPRYVPLEIVMRVCVAEGRRRGDVRRALLERFSARVLPDGTLGLFHPDALTFGQHVALGPLVAAARSVPGVVAVRPVVFQRLGARPTLGASPAWPTRDEIALGRDEIARLDGLAAHPHRGRLSFEMEGGL